MANNWQNIIVQEGQSLYDIALQHYGNAEAIIDLVRDNGLQGVTQQLQAGQMLKINTSSDKYNKAIVNYYKANHCLPATQQGVVIMDILRINIEAAYQPFSYNNNDHTYYSGTYNNYLYIYFDYQQVRRLRLEFTSDSTLDYFIRIYAFPLINEELYGRGVDMIIDVTAMQSDYIGLGIMFTPIPMTGTLKLIKLS